MCHGKRSGPWERKCVMGKEVIRGNGRAITVENKWKTERLVERKWARENERASVKEMGQRKRKGM